MTFTFIYNLKIFATYYIPETVENVMYESTQFCMVFLEERHYFCIGEEIEIQRLFMQLVSSSITRSIKLCIRSLTFYFLLEDTQNHALKMYSSTNSSKP